jgi:2-dehydropantoate 2-reductase
MPKMRARRDGLGVADIGCDSNGIALKARAGFADQAGLEIGKSMKFAMMGSGGVGGFFGGRLALAGYDVSFVARGAHLEAMRRDGLTIENEAQGNLHVPKVEVTDDPATLGRMDVVILSVKLWDTESAIRAIAPMVGPETAVISLQNGVIKDDILLRELPAANVMGGVCYVATHIARPGVIHQTGTMQRIVVGEHDGRRSGRAVGLHEALAKSGVKAELSDDVRRAIWEKFVFLAALSGATTTIRKPIGPIRSNAQSRELLADIMGETVAVGRALGVALPADFAQDRLKFADGLPADMTSSMHHDYERGNRLEVRWLAGAVVELGRKAGVPTPANRAVWDILALHADGRAR